MDISSRLKLHGEREGDSIYRVCYLHVVIVLPCTRNFSLDSFLRIVHQTDRQATLIFFLIRGNKTEFVHPTMTGIRNRLIESSTVRFCASLGRH